jgi:hypothetical protein
MEATAKFHDPNTGEDILNVIKEVPISFLTSYIVPKTSPFIPKLNKALVFARESGLFHLAVKNVKTYLQVKRVRRFTAIQASRSEDKKIKFHHLRDVFLFFLTCSSVSCGVFLIEILNGRLTQKKLIQRKLKMKKQHEIVFLK